MPDGLASRRIAVTRPRESAASLVAALENAGATVLVAPAIAIAPPPSWAALDAALSDISRFDWIAFTSANAVRAVAERWSTVHARGAFPARPRLAAVGNSTAATITQLLRDDVDLIATEQTAAGLAREMPVVEGTRVLFPAGNLARHELPQLLGERGGKVVLVEAYHTRPAEELDGLARLLAEEPVDAVLFASPSSVAYVLDALREAGVDPAAMLQQVVVACGGPTTAEAAAAAGVTATITCAFEPPAQLVASLGRAFDSQQFQRNQ